MSRKNRMVSAIAWTLLGTVLIVLGILTIVYQAGILALTTRVHEETHLVKGTPNYQIWSSPIHLLFKCYLFNVTNPGAVMQGENPQLNEYGPFTFNEVFEKNVIEVDEENDEMTYTASSRYMINKEESVDLTSRAKVTILNGAYLSAIAKLQTLPAAFMKQYGNIINKLFPNPKSIFLTLKAGDVLTSGFKIVCNRKKNPDLALICDMIKGSDTPGLKPTDKEGVYFFNFFETLNGTARGPFTVQRGVKDIKNLGNITAYKGVRIQKIWNTEECNTVQGTDAVTWAPLVTTPYTTVHTYTSDICRTITLNYERDVKLTGMLGSRFSMTQKLWNADNITCYCPKVNNEVKCLPTGLLDLSTCMEAPLLISEPHFLHGDPELLQYARGLKPTEERHATYIVIEPLTGSPLSGQKKTQFNMKLARNDEVLLLNNVSEGYFPLSWCEQGNTPKLPVAAFTYQTLRISYLIWFMQYIPLIVGVFIIFATALIYSVPEGKSANVRPVAESVLIIPNTRVGELYQRRPPRRP